MSIATREMRSAHIIPSLEAKAADGFTYYNLFQTLGHYIYKIKNHFNWYYNLFESWIIHILIETIRQYFLYSKKKETNEWISKTLYQWNGKDKRKGLVVLVVGERGWWGGRDVGSFTKHIYSMQSVIN